MIKDKDLEERALEILRKIDEEEKKEIEQVIEEAVENNSDQDGKSKEEKIKELKEKIEEIKMEKKKKESKLEKLKQIDELDELKSVEKIDFDQIKIATEAERENFADKLMFLAKSIKENRFLAKKTLQAFDLYRARMIDRNIKEKDLGVKVDNLS
ncbi:hypothetical protein MWH28_08505 [Natroniella sulfidigena]|uniref:hypothetical protein n=1 Tax=Natroniella sulfidigena TaxID=723921 RepID=UPI00200B19C4|nr:hypothetical protein [Natroniella sulfidigena]MCK8817397.1 hypothetical protein [Natroniella sulfidigena]